MTYQHQREPLAVKFGMAIPRALNNGFGYLSDIPGYKGVLAPLLAFGALAVGVETIYTAMPETSMSVPRIERKFIPKLGVEDGAEIGRLIPMKSAAYAITQAALPDSVDRFVPSPANKTVWTDPTFWVAIALCSALQYQESKLFRRKPYEQVKADASKANATQRMQLNPKALDVARAKVAKHNAYGMGAETASGAMVILLYGVEFLGFMYGFKGATTWTSSMLWCLYTVFGFEVFYDRGQVPAQPNTTNRTTHAQKHTNSQRQRSTGEGGAHKNSVQPGKAGGASRSAR